MIDIHSHILPGVDDGAQTMEDAIAMARAAVEAGIHTIIATPHHQTSRYYNEKEEVLLRVRELNQVLKQQDIPLQVLPGQEVRLYGELLEDLAADKVLTLNDTGEYMLVEFPSSHVPRYAESLLYRLQLEGVTPIIAHPERNTEIAENPDVLYNLVEKGALAQVTAASVAGEFGKKIKKLSLQMIEHQLVHVLASDAHNISNRSFKIKESNDVIEKELGFQVLSQLQENAEAIVSGKYMHKEQPRQLRMKKFFGIF
ncbi:tyrosine-protein phosphatase [Ectobacillus ponti]|uniref:Tyrosine-protein phosphatase n=1 Tax=Ectobacillus ponti TaxID=2961894 RepID=A0AA42BRY5_9BACI|nr:CpsB/CapC family capsule biosynthesis tyrosine phosphatase [Ectobacillus ponti]MCP8967858.1 tyrosine protein phosphatase [Ectobacillus ponti]